MKTLKDFASREESVSAACDVLMGLAWKNETHRDAIVKSGGVTLALAAVRQHAQSERVGRGSSTSAPRSALGLLFALASHNPVGQRAIVEGSGLDVVLQCMDATSRDRLAAHYGCGILTVLSQASEVWSEDIEARGVPYSCMLSRPDLSVPECKPCHWWKAGSPSTLAAPAA